MAHEPNEPDWRTILDPGERVLWRGTPGDVPMPKMNRNFWLLLGGMSAVIGAVFVFVGLAVAGAETVIGLGFVAMGSISLMVALGAVILPARLHRQKMQKMRYALTDRRAVIYDGEVTSFRIAPDMELDYQAGNPPSLWFGEEASSLVVNGRPVMQKVGFAAIPEAADLARQIRDIQTQLAVTAHDAG